MYMQESGNGGETHLVLRYKDLARLWVKLYKMKTYSMIEVGSQEKIVEFEIPVFENTETCVVTDFEDNNTEELEVEIPTFMRG